ncbi:unnamed protein product [Polarella glacialis]|uniref:Uncharacterized protein n=1 Tax=Polarella glacialis TaxID=89957 RepID=A0A813D4A5_POLGL|nr:unnamed protein product [Polarella glacialis]
MAFLVIYALDKQEKDSQPVDRHGPGRADRVLLGEVPRHRGGPGSGRKTLLKEASMLPPSLTKLVLALVLATLVLPAWRWYILPVVKSLGGFEEVEEDGEEAPGMKGREGEGRSEGYCPPDSEPSRWPTREPDRGSASADAAAGAAGQEGGTAASSEGQQDDL